MSRAAYPAEESLLVSQTLSSSYELFCAQSSNLNLTTRVRSNLDYDTLYWFGFDRTNVRFELPLLPGRDSQHGPFHVLRFKTPIPARTSNKNTIVLPETPALQPLPLPVVR